MNCIVSNSKVLLLTYCFTGSLAAKWDLRVYRHFSKTANFGFELILFPDTINLAFQGWLDCQTPMTFHQFATKNFNSEFYLCSTNPRGNIANYLLIMLIMLSLFACLVIWQIFAHKSFMCGWHCLTTSRNEWAQIVWSVNRTSWAECVMRSCANQTWHVRTPHKPATIIKLA